MLKWILREFRYKKLLSFLYVLNLAVGLSGLMLIESFKYSLVDVLKKNEKNFLAADLSFEARRLFSNDELDQFDGILSDLGVPFDKQNLFEFYSMFSQANGINPRLVFVKSIEKKYPLYGEILFKEEQSRSFNIENWVWIDEDTRNLFSLNIGQKVLIAETPFVITKIIRSDSTQTFRWNAIAPRFYISDSSLKKLNLSNSNSTISQSVLYKFNKSFELDILKSQVLKLIKDSSIQVKIPKDASEGASRLLAYLTDYLGLISITALFISIIGMVFTAQNLILDEIKNSSIFNVLGLTINNILYVQIFKFIILSVIGSTFSFLISYICSIKLNIFIQELIPAKINITFDLRLFFLFCIFSSTVSVLTALPYFILSKKLPTSDLLSENFRNKIERNRGFSFYFLPILVLFYFLSLQQAHSFRLSLLYMLIVVTVFVLIYVFFSGYVSSLLILLEKNWKAKIILIKHARKRIEPFFLSVSLVIVLSFLLVVPHVKKSLEDEFLSESGRSYPSYFLIDIQEDQISKLQNHLAKFNAVLDDLSPMVRAKLTMINNVKNEISITDSKIQTREEESEQRFKNRGFNLSYRVVSEVTDTLVAGNGFDKKVNTNQISIEKSFADRLNLKLGDILKFDIQGVEIEGEIVNFRKVKWNTFRPNFFVLFAPGIIDEAPKSFIATIGHINEIEKTKITTDIFKNFNNITMVDIENGIKGLIDISDQISLIIQFMMYLSLVAGIIVMITILINQTPKLVSEIKLIQIIGATKSDIRKIVYFEFFTLAGFIVLMSVSYSILITLCATFFVFNTSFEVSWNSIFIAVFASIILILVIAEILNYFLFIKK